MAKPRFVLAEWGITTPTRLVDLAADPRCVVPYGLLWRRIARGTPVLAALTTPAGELPRESVADLRSQLRWVRARAVGGEEQ